MNCFPGDSLVTFAYGVKKIFRRAYRGELVGLVMDTGKVLRATPNHPVLTPRGWTPIGEVLEGDRVADVSRGLHNSGEGVQFSYAFDKTSHLIDVVHAKGNKEQFHGDGQDGDLCAVPFPALVYMSSSEIDPAAAETMGRSIKGLVDDVDSIPDERWTRVSYCLRIKYDGMVYNFETEHGCYVVDGLIVSNCRCAGTNNQIGDAATNLQETNP